MNFWPEIEDTSPKKNINDIHAMLMALTDEEKKGLLGLQQTEMKEEEDKFYDLEYFSVHSSTLNSQHHQLQQGQHGRCKVQ